MDTLPPEILHNILKPENHCVTGTPFGSTVKESYLKLRLVCRTFSDIIAPHAFASLCITDDECTLDRLSNISRRADLAPLLKSYLFHFNEPRIIAPSTMKDYLKVISLPKEQSEETLSAHTEACRQQISYLTRVLNFQISGDVEKVHVKLLSESFPNLQTVGITVHPAQTFSNILPNLNITSSYSGSSNWGPLVFRSFLKGLALRTESTAGLKPITTISIQGLIADCLFLSSDFLEKVSVGMRAIREVNFSMTMAHSLHDGTTPSWLYPVGRLLRASEDLRNLTLSTLTYPRLNSLLHFTPMISGPTKVPTVHHWKHLNKLFLQYAFIPRELFKKFLTIHKRTLSQIILHTCDLIDHNRVPIIMHSNPHMTINPGTQESHPTPWIDVFRHLRSTNKPVLTTLSLKYLSEGKVAHEHHLRQSRVREWQMWIMQSPSDNIPEPSAEDPKHGPDGADSNFDYEDTHWCQECSNISYDSDEDDDEDIFGIGYPHFEEEEEEEELDEDDDFDEGVEYVLHHNHYHHHHHHGYPDMGLW
ncbi:hypothetical protein L873DRAFT_1834461 [Choiromyces venosus 120613-1]|uniref:Uncharacterized protein n=1 Tax=Choiromyces venosus 120613-1 TaxID=1336337 RepID=A0A3N4JTP6_9PEZI|nr:hypothetical protein L873DRAFT_1834461 [Choiromyces venosus 120613-1]